MICLRVKSGLVLSQLMQMTTVAEGVTEKEALENCRKRNRKRNGLVFDCGSSFTNPTHPHPTPDPDSDTNPIYASIYSRGRPSVVLKPAQAGLVK